MVGMSIGSDPIAKVYWGSSEVNSIFYGTTEVYRAGGGGGYEIDYTFEDGGWIYDAGFMIEDSNGNELDTKNNPIISPTQQVTLKIIRVRGQYDVNELIINTATLNGNDISFTKIPRDDSYPPDDYRVAGYYTATLTLSQSNTLIINVNSQD